MRTEKTSKAVRLIVLIPTIIGLLGLCEVNPVGGQKSHFRIALKKTPKSPDFGSPLARIIFSSFIFFCPTFSIIHLELLAALLMTSILLDIELSGQTARVDKWIACVGL